MESSNKPYYLMGASITGGILLALFYRNLREYYTSKNNKKKAQRKLSALERRTQRRNSRVMKVYNRIKTSATAKFNEGNTLVEELNFLDTPTCEISKVNHLAWDMNIYEFPDILSPLLSESKNFYRDVYGGEGFLPESSFISMNSFVLSTPAYNNTNSPERSVKWLRGGPRKHLFFRPDEVKAAIVTCGGICPGVNVIVRELTMSLYYNYKVKDIYGIPHGFQGFYSNEWKNEWKKLSPDMVKTIHHNGGTFLGTSRGGFDLEKIIDSLNEKRINQVYIIGGFGTIKAAEILFEEIKARKLKISICVIPKTIGNDIPIIDSSFGFETCVEHAQKAIKAAYCESRSYQYGIGIVKLIGRYSGFIAMEATLASRDVNICLVPEFGFELYGNEGLLEHVYRRVKGRNYCIIVVAEGAGDAMMDDNLEDRGYDASGNLKPGDIGLFLKEKLIDFFSNKDINPSVKYIDPTFMIRAVESNPLDKKICTRLAQNTVHSTMAGFTGFAAGIITKNVGLIPIKELLNEEYSTQILPYDEKWKILLANTGQPCFLKDEAVYMPKTKEERLE